MEMIDIKSGTKKRKCWMIGMKIIKSDTTLDQLDGDDVVSEEVDFRGERMSSDKKLNQKSFHQQ